MVAVSRLQHRLFLESGTTGRAFWVLSVARALPGSPCCWTCPPRSSGAARRPAARATPPHQRLPASAPSERPCTRTGSVTLRSWLRRLLLLLSQQRGGRERLLGVSSPARLSRCRLLAAKEKSLC